MDLDTILFEVLEFCVAGKREYHPGHKMTARDIDGWAPGDEAEQEREIAKLLIHNHLAKADHVAEAPVEPAPAADAAFDPAHAAPAAA